MLELEGKNKKPAGVSLQGFVLVPPPQDHRPQGGNPEVRSTKLEVRKNSKDQVFNSVVGLKSNKFELEGKNKKPAGVSLQAFVLVPPTHDHRPNGGNPKVRRTKLEVRKILKTKFLIPW